MPLIETRGAASAQGFGEFAQSAAVNYIEDVFSTYLYTGNGSTQTITNNIDLSGKGGLVWVKNRAGATTDNVLGDTVRGASKQIFSNRTLAEQNYSPYGISAFGSSGFTVADDGAGNYITNANTVTYASWTFRKQTKFFDIVTYTGNGSSQTINHNLGSTPGCIIIKKLDSTTFNAGWAVYHRSLTTPSNYYLRLDTTDAQTNYGGSFISNVGSTSFDVNGASGFLGLNGSSYVAYLFAHDAGGFGLSGSDNVISCGSFTTDGSGNATVSLGYEPQWILWRNSQDAANWWMADNMRGMTADGTDAVVYANLSNAEASASGMIAPTATGFRTIGGASWATNKTHIYIAIRRGPMKTPTSGTSVFSPTVNTTAVDATTPVVLTPDASDLWLTSNRSAAAPYWLPRLAAWGYMRSSNTTAENTSYTWTQQTQSNLLPSASWWSAGTSQVNYFFKRAPGFFDVVCYTGNGSGSRAVTHNLGVAPEMVIVKQRTGAIARSWWVLTTATPFLNVLNSTEAANASGVPANLFGDSTYNNYIAPTATTVTLSPSDEVNTSGNTYVAYLFATLAGVSKVGSYTGSGTTKQIDCGFTGGARFVLIKRTDSTGDWYVYDSARGIVSGNDPYLLLNSTAAEVTNTDYVDTYSAGFELSSTAPAALNANGGTYIFLAIA